MKRAVGIFLAVLFVALGFLTAGYCSSQKLEVETYAFSVGLGTEWRIAHLSDLHFPKLGVSEEAILSILSDGDLDAIFLTGDVFDTTAGEEDLRSVGVFFTRLRRIAPTYAVIGNHEIGSPLYEEYRRLCIMKGVDLLENRSVPLDVGDKKILLAGVKDAARPTMDFRTDEKVDFSILLAHRPELFSAYAEAGFSYCFCGHAHGGQARFFGRGLYAPDQGLFPSYTSGTYRSGDSTMLVSRGLGDGKNGFRIFNSYSISVVSFF